MASVHKENLTDLLVRAIAPGVVVWGAIVGFGLLITGPLTGLSKDEESVNKTLASDRTPTWNQITMLWSHVGNTEYVIAVCILISLILLWRTRDWLFSIVPVIAISLQATIFVLATLVVGRPRPTVPHLDPAPPTSSYPSGHVGASTALYLSLALLAARIERTWLRVLTTVVCLALPLLVTFARLYRGMHHVTDVSVGMLNGIACALLAWGWWRFTSRRKVTDRARAAVS
ncbi:MULTISPECIES: phosphatase PAP2 family protein [unclassified Phycicoccus]|uniref:phosphatase PAP2 family protein n=1 Tax=unclassified Phycicoccus TaxID=2637926 RepID=UPI00070355DD|nr:MULTISPECIES: phosphatase PAP2 family protein [unclassified Phycicoccus]KQU65122.1 phospholipid phosphatase [Phycicoccus sp. Root101]KQZ89748.1 phospholipid phosphatase [Phycicoccus sp. Root563]